MTLLIKTSTAYRDDYVKDSPSFFNIYVIDLAVMNNDYSLKYVYLQIQKDAKCKLIESD